MTKTDLLRYLPDFLKTYTELRAIADTESGEIENIKDKAQEILKNCSLQTCDSRRLMYYENLFDSVCPGNNEAFRRWFLTRTIRLRNLPLTEAALAAWLKDIVGDTAAVKVDYENYTMYITIYAPPGTAEEAWLRNQFKSWIEKRIPANIQLKISRVTAHKMLSQYTHAELSQYTHGEISGEVI